jgi:hypothetical protein
MTAKALGLADACVLSITPETLYVRKVVMPSSLQSWIRERKDLLWCSSQRKVSETFGVPAYNMQQHLASGFSNQAL